MKSDGLSNLKFNNNNNNKATVYLEKDGNDNDGKYIDKKNVGNKEIVIMNHGDVLYFPAGMWHKIASMSDEIDERENGDDDYKVDNDNDNDNHTNSSTRCC